MNLATGYGGSRVDTPFGIPIRHRTLMKGGVFLYPPTTKAPKGKLRLMYEANPMAMLVEQAGGKAYSGTERTMEVEPNKIHQRVPVILGSGSEVDHVLRFISK